MSRPLLEVADLIHSAGTAFIERNRNWIRWTHIKVLLAIARCRTAALGGHIDECTRCGHRATISYNSCRNRHCPKCQTGARGRWIQSRRRELLPSPYVHVVFTLPSQLAALALQNKKIVYSLLLRASAGFDPVLASFFPSKYSDVCFAANSWPLSSPPFSTASFILPAIWLCLRNPKSSQPGCDRCSEKIGSSTPNRPSGAPNMCSSISAVTPTASPSPTIDWYRWPTAKSPFVGAIRRTTIKKN